MTNTVLRGLSLIGEAYQTSFDELIKAIEDKVELPQRQDGILIANFIQTHGLDKDTAVSNINKDTVEHVIKLIKQKDGLNEAYLNAKDELDVVILSRLIRNPNFNEIDINEIVRYCVKDKYGSTTRVHSVKCACAFFEEQISKTLYKCLSYHGGI